MLSAALQLIGGLGLLVFGADRFVSGAAGLARNLGISPLIVGLTVVGTATSMPEVLVGVAAAVDGKTEIAIGNAIGSNIANIGLVLGITALVKPLVVSSDTLRRECLIMAVAMMLALALMLDLYLGRGDALVLLLALGGILVWIVRVALASSTTDPLIGEFTQELRAGTSTGRSLLLLIGGLLLLLLGAELLVRGATVVAKSIGISDLVIGLTIVAVGTSLPELAASLASVLKDEADIAVGNIIGSSMFNMLMVLGLPCLVHPTAFASEVLWRDFALMVILTVAMVVMVFVTGKGKFGRGEGAMLLACFVAYQLWLFNPGAY